MIFEVTAVTWDGRPSFKMQGQYGRDEFGSFVLTEQGVRFDIPRDAIIMRKEFAPPAPVKLPEAPVPAPAPPPEPPAPHPLPRLQLVKPITPPAPVKKKPAEKKPPKIQPKKTASSKEAPKK